MTNKVTLQGDVQGCQTQFLKRTPIPKNISFLIKLEINQIMQKYCIGPGASNECLTLFLKLSFQFFKQFNDNYLGRELGIWVFGE